MLRAGSSYATRGHHFRLQKTRARYDLRKYYFTNRVVNMWNSLSSYVVSAKSVNCWRIDSIISGKIIRLFTIFVLRFTEPETAVKLQSDSFSITIVGCFVLCNNLIKFVGVIYCLLFTFSILFCYYVYLSWIKLIIIVAIVRKVTHNSGNGHKLVILLY